jgi:DNA-binding CsgD family transcriptional regulator
MEARELNEEKRPRGRPLIELTPSQKSEIKQMASEGLAIEEIAECMGFSRATIYRLCQRDKNLFENIRRGKAIANAKVKRTLFNMATSGRCFPASALWAKCQMDWIEADRRKEIETGANQKVIVVIGEKPKQLEGPTINISREELLAAATLPDTEEDEEPA